MLFHENVDGGGGKRPNSYITRVTLMSNLVGINNSRYTNTNVTGKYALG